MARLYKRGRVWYSDLFVQGRRVRTPLDTDKQTAQAKLLRLIEGRTADRYGRAIKGASWMEFKAKYFEWLKQNKAHGTYKLEAVAVKLLEAFSPITKLEQITPRLLDEFKTHLKTPSLTPETVNRRVRAIKAIMRKAEAWGYIEPQNWRSVSRFKEVKGKLHFFTAPELRRLITYCKGQWLTVCLLGARAGLRRGEIHTLTWQDVDFKANRIHICPKDGWTPKDNERRYIPLTEDLKAHLKAIQAHSRGPWVVMDGERRETIAGMTTCFRKRVAAAGLEGSIHTLRHTFASHLAQAGVPLYTISKLLGHSSITTTEIYAHLCPDTMDSAVKSLPKL